MHLDLRGFGKRDDQRILILRLFQKSCTEYAQGGTYKISLSLIPKIWLWKKEFCELTIVILGLRIHYRKN